MAIDTTPSSRHAARRSATDEKITDAVLDIMRREGMRAVTIEAVSERSGVAKTSIYRRYVDRTEMMRGVLDRLTPTPPENPELSAEGLVKLLGCIQRAFEKRIGLRVVGAFISSDDEMIREWRDEVINPHTDALRQFFARGVEAGVLAPDLDQGLMYELTMGGLLMRDALLGDVPENWPDRVVAALWPVLRAPEV